MMNTVRNQSNLQIDAPLINFLDLVDQSNTISFIRWSMPFHNASLPKLELFDATYLDAILLAAPGSTHFLGCRLNLYYKGTKSKVDWNCVCPGKGLRKTTVPPSRFHSWSHSLPRLSWLRCPQRLHTQAISWKQKNPAPKVSAMQDCLSFWFHSGRRKWQGQRLHVQLSAPPFSSSLHGFSLGDFEAWDHHFLPWHSKMLQVCQHHLLALEIIGWTDCGKNWNNMRIWREARETAFEPFHPFGEHPCPQYMFCQCNWNVNLSIALGTRLPQQSS